MTKITDGDYKYGGGINIELPRRPCCPRRRVAASPRRPRLPNGLRYSAQLGIEYGAEFVISKSGKADKVKTLAPQSFANELPRRWRSTAADRSRCRCPCRP